VVTNLVPGKSAFKNKPGIYSIKGNQWLPFFFERCFVEKKLFLILGQKSELFMLPPRLPFSRLKKYLWCFLFLFFGIGKIFSGLSLHLILPKDSVKKEDSAKVKKHAKLKFELSAASNNTFKGRRDTNNVPIISPLLKYTTKRNWYFSGTLVNEPGSQRMFDEFDLSIGKKIVFSDNWDATVAYSHYFFDSRVTRIKATVQNYASATVNYDWNILYSSLELSYSEANDKFKYKGKKVGNKTGDFSVYFDNSHAFDFDDFLRKGNSLSLTPEADLVLGTQNYMASYTGRFNSNNKAYKDKISKFELTAITFAFDVSYTIGNLTFDLYPYYTIPYNAQPGAESTPYFVMSGSIYYVLKFKK
jgi:hypothetical protein